MARHGDRRVVLDDVEQFLAVAALRLVWVCLLTKLALQVFPEVSADNRGDLRYAFAREPSS